MTFRHLNIFLLVCKEKNMTRVAEKLYMTQPSVTQAIKELEAYYETLLFERRGKTIAISNDGYKLLPIAQNIVETFQNSKNIIKNTFTYELTLGTSATVGTYLISNISKKLKNIPNFEIKYIVDNTHNIEQMILDSNIDIGIVEGEIHSKQLTSTSFLKDELGLVCSSESEFSKFQSISLSKLNNSKFIYREEGSGTKELIESIFHQNNIKVESVGIINNIEAIKNMVIDNMGISILPKLSILKEVENKKLHYIEIEQINLSRNFKIIYHKDKVIDKYFENILTSLLSVKLD